MAARRLETQSLYRKKQGHMLYDISSARRCIFKLHERLTDTMKRGVFKWEIGKGCTNPGNIFLYPQALCNSMSCQIFPPAAKGMKDEAAAKPGLPLSMAATVVWTSGPINTERQASAWVSCYCTAVLTALSDSRVLLAHISGGLITEQHRKCDATQGSRRHFNLSPVALFAHSADDFSALLRNPPPQ